MATRQSPMLRRRRLGLELRRLREAAGRTIEEMATAMECSPSKISRIETGKVSATPRDVRDMLAHYSVSDKQREELVQAARDARQKGWWHTYSDAYVDTPDAYGLESAVGLGAAASSIRMYGALLVPGLLQTAEYARTVISATSDLAPEQIERRVQLRLARQEGLTQQESPTLLVVLDDAVLHRQVGGRDAMRRQLDRLLEAADQPSLTLQVLPFSTGAHAGMNGAMTIWSFPEEGDSDIVHLEVPLSDVYLDSPTAISRYASLFERLRRAALEPDDSIAYIASLAQER